MPQLIRLYIRQVLTGFGLSALFVGGLLWFDVARLWSLISASDAGLLAAFLLWLFNGIVFAGVQFGIAIMRLADDDSDAGRGKRDLARAGVPIVVPASVAPSPGKLLRLRKRA